MNGSQGRFLTGLFVVLIGIGLLVVQLNPDLAQRFLGGPFTWPWLIIALGLLMLLLGLVGAGSGLTIPGAVILTVGGILLYQVRNQDWESWSFVWALIPASVGVGLMLTGLLRRKSSLARTGVWFLFTNLVLFGIFWAVFRRDSVGMLRFWPILLILLGAIFLFQALLPKNQRQ